MTDKRKNPPAFPAKESGYSGMTMRDWFAGQALAGATLGAMAGPDPGAPPEVLARSCYAIANAMLAEREKGSDE